jgi:3-oxoadipate enol-lactonase
MGGYIAFAFYQRFPHYVSGIILAATRAGTDTPEGKANRDRTAALVRESGPNQVVTGMLSKLMSPKTYTTHPEVVERVSRILGGATTKGIIGASLGMKDRQDFSARLDQINVPALIIHGRDDQLVPVSEAEKMDQGIPDSRLVLVPDAGHLVNLEQPDLFNQSIAHFLAELP